VNVTKSTISTVALRFAATIVLLTPTVAAQAQGTGQTICRDVQVPPRFGPIGNNERAHHQRVVFSAAPNDGATAHLYGPS
jgi:hypothetical protein